MDSVLVMQCRNQSGTGCLVFVAEALDEPKPVPEGDKVSKDPETALETEPNTKEDSKDLEKPSILPDGPSEEQRPEVGMEPRNVKRSIIRIHIFRIDASGNITLDRS
jgi:hypothetical protein